MSYSRFGSRATVAISALAIIAAAGCGGNTIPSANSSSGSALSAEGSSSQNLGANFTHTMSSARSTGASGNTAYASVIEQDKPVAFYELNDTGSRMADSSGHGLDGTYGVNVVKGAAPITNTGSTTPTFVGGNYDPSMFASAPINPMLQPQAVTVEAWIKESAINTTGTFVPVVAYGKQSQGPSYSLTINPQNSIRFWARTTSGSVSAGGFTVLVPGRSYHVAATYDGSHVSLYLNGRLEYSNPGTGQLYYQALNSHDGLGIGGSLDKGAPQFTGNVSQVAVFSTALSQAAIQAHYVAGNITPLLTERAQNANKFIDSIGINVHLHYTGTPYDTQFSTVKSLLVNLGVRHVRDGLVDTQWQTYYDRLNELGRAGIRSTMTTTLGQTAQLLTSYPSRLKDSFEAYEAPNEMDIVYRNDPNWVQHARDFQQLLYTSVKSNSQTANFRIIGPSFTSNQAQIAVGDLSKWMDNGNIHQYFASYNPGTDGWGAHTNYGIVGSIPWNMNVERIVAGNRPLIATETGYNTGVSANNVPMQIQAKYLPRSMFEMFNNGVVRSMIYELLDFDPNDHGNNYGLVASNMQPKPAYTALKNLIGVLHDPAPAFQASVLQYTLGGDLAAVHHTLLQKADQSFQLALWQESRSYNGGTHALMPSAPQTVTVTLPNAPKSATLESFDDNGNVSSTPATIIGNTVTVSVSDDMSIVTFSL